MEADSRPQRRSDVLAQTAGETLILLTPDSGEYFTLDEVGGRIWELADGSRSVDEIADVLVKEYEAPLEEIRSDALDLLRELAAKQLISDGAPGT